MSAMRYAAFFVVALSFLIPASASAAFVPLVTNKGCAAASAGNPTGEKSFSFITGAQEVKAYLDSKIACPSACFYETVTLEVGASGIKTSIRGINACTRTEKDPNAEDAVKDKRGCGAGLTPPTVTVKVTGVVQKEYPAKSRCDAENISAAIDAVAKGDLDGAQAALERLAAPPDLPPQLRGAITGNQGLIDAFVQTGVTQQQAANIVQNNPILAANYIQAILQNNTQAIAASAAQLNLNPNITSAQQQAVMQVAAQSVPQQQAPAQQAPNAASTFADGAVSDIVKAKCAIASIESGSCQGNHSLRGPITRRGDRAYGKYQVMGANVPSWTMRSCGRAYTPEAFLRDPQCQEKVFETIFSEHVRSCGSYEGAASKWFSGRCQITNSNDGYTSVSTYVRRFAAVFGSSTMPFGSAASLSSFGRSPFSQVNPFGEIRDQSITCDDRYCYLQNWPGQSTGGPVSTGMPVSTGAPVSTGGPVSTSGQVSTGGQVSTSGGTGQIGGTSGGTGLPVPAQVPPVASLIVQPREPLRDNPIVVSWSSVGMRLAPLCRVLVASSTSAILAEANEGSKTIRLGSAGSYKFTLECKAMSGADVRQTTTVLVK